MKGQTSVEFLVLLGFMIIVFNAFIIVTHQSVITNNERANKEILKSEADHLYEEIYVAHQVKNGYARTFEIPEKINGQPLETKIIDNEVNFKLENQEYVLFLPFNITTTQELLTKENIITKNNDQIIIQPKS